MHKYFAIARAEWLDALQNYQEVILWIIIQSIPILGMSYVWSSSGQNLTPGRISWLITYYLVIFVVDRLTSFYFERNMQDEIRQGTFSRYLLKPIPIRKFLIVDNLGGKAFNTLFLLMPIMAFISTLFSGQILLPSPVNFFLFIISLICAFFIQFYIATLVTSVSFFLEQAYAFNHLHWMLDAVIGGYMLPLTFYPDLLQRLFALFPFPYVYYFPVAIFTGQFIPYIAIQKICFALFWVFALYLISTRVWNIGLKRYSSVGN